MASTRFNNSVPLLRLGRYDEARTLLCGTAGRLRRADGTVREELGEAVPRVLADLEDKTGDRARAVRFEEVALGYTYQAGVPEDCAIIHHNLADSLERQGADPGLVLAHRLADAVICFQTQAGSIRVTLRNLANLELPVAPPAFADVVAQVEAVPGVRFGALFERLPRTASDGDAAISAVWRLVEQARESAVGAARHRQAVLDSMPRGIREAFEQKGEAVSAALRGALNALPEEEAEAVLQQLREAGLVGRGPSAIDMQSVLRDFEPLLEVIAAVAKGDDGPQEQIEAILLNLEEKGWKLTEAVRRLWTGERDEIVLTAGIDPNSAQLVRRLLQLAAT